MFKMGISSRNVVEGTARAVTCIEDV